MKAGRELDRLIAEAILEHTVTEEGGGSLCEVTQTGSRQLQHYSSKISAAWEVVEKMGITLIPIECNSWFAMVGPSGGWKSPAEFLDRLQSGRFIGTGAAVSESASLTICLAALQALENRVRVANLDQGTRSLAQ